MTIAGKKPIRNLPSTIEITSTTNVEEAKKILARATKTRDHHRLAIVDPENKAIVKDRTALLLNSQGVASTSSIYVKDLGPQISWRTVYLVEYAGPILLVALLAGPLRPYVYPAAIFGKHTLQPLSDVQTWFLWMMLAHFIKREIETVFVHKFSAATMPAAYVFRNSAHYWLLAGLNISYWVFAPNSAAATPMKALPHWTQYLVWTGLATYGYGELANFYTHIVLSNLRPAGTTKRGIPKGFGFNWVTCPNYLFEIIAWIGILMVTRSIATAFFIAVAWFMMHKWAVVREKRYRKEFAGTYRPHKYPLTPFLALPIRKERK